MDDLKSIKDAFAGRCVLLTGHTGFKGGWMALWLRELGAEVVGVALPPLDARDFFNAVSLEELLDHRIGDIRAPEAYDAACAGIDADLLVHMAAQPLVRLSYDEPRDTLLTNVVGTATVLDAARRMPSLKGVVAVTSDKCYENREWVWGYRENDPMGGADPYSASKGCAELVVAAYRRSFFQDPDGPALASVRAGNVFGGGDWSKDRLIPDLAKAALAGETVQIRSPASIRPWQHVLEPVWGYILLAARLLRGERAYADGWNFGPDPEGVVDVGSLAGAFVDAWGEGGPKLDIGAAPKGPHEAEILRLDSTRARVKLGWAPRLTVAQGVALAVDWYKASAGGVDMRTLSARQINEYAERL